jgi:hypothetical protein
MNRKMRGMQLLRRHQSLFLSISIFLVNQQFYRVAFTRTVFGLRISMRTYEFGTPEQADKFFHAAVVKSFPNSGL